MPPDFTPLDAERALRHAAEAERGTPGTTGTSSNGAIMLELTRDGRYRNVRIASEAFDRGDATTIGLAVADAVAHAAGRQADRAMAELRAAGARVSPLASAAATRSAIKPETPDSAHPAPPASTKPGGSERHGRRR